jgi:orotidine-5'-phosphate decarboxylase
LDSEFEKLPRFLVERHGVGAVFEFNKQIIDATADLVCAYKPNLAFYEALGPAGLEQLQKTREYIPREIPVIADGKRGDIENTARLYAQAFFGYYQFDAATVNPLMGGDAVAPFLQWREKLSFILCRTSNPGARDFQELDCQNRRLYQRLAEKAREWNAHRNVGVVVGATAPRELANVRAIVGEEMFLLIVGLGAQGAPWKSAVRGGVNARGERAIFNLAREIIFASSEKDFAQAARRRAEHWCHRINEGRQGGVG